MRLYPYDGIAGSAAAGTIAVRHLLEGLKQRGEVAPLIAQRLGALEHLVGTLRGRQRDLEPSRRVERKLDVFVHEAQVKPGFFGRIEDDRRARLEHRGADRARLHHVHRPLPVDTGASSIHASFARTRAASSRLAWGLTVLTSIQVLPAASPARIPSGSDATSSSTRSSGTEVKRASAASATSRGVSHHCSPWSIRSWARSEAANTPRT